MSRLRIAAWAVALANGLFCHALKGVIDGCMDVQPAGIQDARAETLLYLLADIFNEIGCWSGAPAND